MTKRKKSSNKYLKRGIIAIVSLIVFATGAAFGDTNSKMSYSTPGSVGVSLEQDPVLAADAQQLGVNAPVTLSFSSSLHAIDIADDNKTIGTFLAPNTIQIKTGLSKQQELSTLAYEYMHYFWMQLTPEQRQDLGIKYRQLAVESSYFKSLVRFYYGSQDTLDNEMNSTACTLVPPYALTAEFNAYCNQFIPNRAILFQ